MKAVFSYCLKLTTETLTPLPTTLKHLCLDMVQDRRNRQSQGGIAPGGRGEDGRIVARGLYQVC